MIFPDEVDPLPSMNRERQVNTTSELSNDFLTGLGLQYFLCNVFLFFPKVTFNKILFFMLLYF